MKKHFTLLLLFFTLTVFAQSDDYTSYFTGDTTDFITETYQSGLLLAGGAGDDDNGMTWFLERSGGGDVLVIRASGSDGYNDYLFSDLGVAVNSVETIVFHNAEAAQDAYVLQQLAGAELIFIAGGDQYDYYQYWKDSPVEDALNALINEKGITVGGTSAGMAILSNCYYAPDGGSADDAEALGNPFHPDMSIIGKDDFLQVPYTQNLITDTHYDQRDRAGRHLAFMARLTNEHNERFYGIAANEYTAVAIDESGIAKAFGEHDEYPEDLVYFLRGNCQEESAPEVITAGEPLTWNRGGAAVKAYRMPATQTGEHTFDLNDWETGTGGIWQNWTAVNGTFSRTETENSDCADGETVNVQNIDYRKITVFPNPTDEQTTLTFPTALTPDAEVKIFNAAGQSVSDFAFEISENRMTLNIAKLPAGFYSLETAADGVFYRGKLFVLK